MNRATTSSRGSAEPAQSSFRRLASTFGAQIYSQAVTVGIQLALVPVLLHYWGAERYGVWLLLSAIPIYLTFADFGFTMAAKNVMTIKVAGGDRSGALVTYQSIFMLLNVVVAAILVILLLALPVIRVSTVFSLGPVSEGAAKTVLFLLAANVLLTQYLLLFASGLRCIGKPTEEVVWAASARLMEGAVTAAAAALGGDILAAALAIVVNRVAFNLATWTRLRFLERWLALGQRHASLDEARTLFHPSVSFMLVSIGQALTIQGPVLILGAIGSPMQVVIFSTARTLARLGTSAINMINFAFTPEYSRLFGMRKFQEFAKLVRFHLWTTLALAAIYVVTLSLTGQWIIAFWTVGKVSVDQTTFVILLVAVAAEMIWSAELMPLASINRHVALSRAFSALSIVALGSCYLSGQHYDDSLIAVATPLVALHVLMTIVSGFRLWPISRSIGARVS
ncbi:lipopolysaccharide biosynthesis protein [Bradyrhizobium yuanmingense]|uniref:lipopolysaccharide biosynthesis protein n=1 Tax=Bradyrhizobium yuanmingense TaxID=108015 RepID=UPI0035138D2C